MSGADARWIRPSKRDPRWAIVFFLVCFVAYALLSPGFSRRPSQYLAAVGACVGLDLALLLWKRVRLVPLSGFITSLGVLLLCDSPYVWPFALMGALSIASKHFIRVEGRHIFNPNDFGLVAVLLFCGDSVTVSAGRWGGSLSGMLLIAFIGILVVSYSGRLDVALAYALTFLVLAPLRHLVSGAPFGALLAPVSGAAFMLFTFFMVTDPRTTPTNSRDRLWFGAALAALDSLLRQLQVQNSPFYALFALTAVMPLWKIYRRPHWTTGSVPHDIHLA